MEGKKRWFLAYCGDFKEKQPNTVLPMRIPLDAFPVKIGRTRENQQGMIYLSDKKAGLISRQHAIISKSGDKMMVTESENVVNGTFLNDRRLQVGVPYEISANDTLDFGIPRGGNIPTDGLATNLPRRPIRYRVTIEGKKGQKSLEGSPNKASKRSPKRPLSTISGGPDAGTENNKKQVLVSNNGQEASLQFEEEKEILKKALLQQHLQEAAKLQKEKDEFEQKLQKEKEEIEQKQLQEAAKLQREKEEFEQKLQKEKEAIELKLAMQLEQESRLREEKEKLEQELSTQKKEPPAAPDEMEDELSCLICFGYLAFAAALPCGHSFCWHCLHGWIEAKTTKNREKIPRCPSCNKDIEISHIRRNIQIDKVAEKVVQTLPGDEKDQVLDWKSRWAKGRELEQQYAKDMQSKVTPMHGSKRSIPSVPEEEIIEILD
eukprot:CAMPEP_0117737622 /NCGR_PEP_ID=MMETSP0947-20121206/2644_1 /TAXON_ID=44440 /ORGANISM="Chattonella subsalsa, Strain CCMP2191" /LENGTH=432 /DNA_ID=CAMNT_0005553157 /DNA_START=1249 /DNA_END=2547 /DNA_ORIENTATION=+